MVTKTQTSRKFMPGEMTIQRAMQETMTKLSYTLTRTPTKIPNKANQMEDGTLCP